MALSSGDAARFKGALQKFEAKKYKEALDDLEGLLKRNPKHGESYCLRGLVKYSIKDEVQDDGLSDIKRGLELDNKSSVSWNITGVWYKLNKRYHEAYGAYVKSYLIDNENTNLQQDLAMLAMNERNYPLLVDVRRRFLRARPNQHMSWTGLAVAQFKAGQYSAAESTLDLYQQVLEKENEARKEPLKPTPAAMAKVDDSEIIMFKVEVVAASGESERALKMLETLEPKILDKLALQTRKAELLTGLGKKQEAIDAWETLIHRNPNCLDYYEQIEKVLDLNTKQKTKFYKLMRDKYPKAEVPKQRPLSFLEGKEFEDYLVEYITDKIQSGASAFSMVKSLYANNTASLKAAVARLEPQDTANWLVFYAKHLSYIGEHDKALEAAEKAVDLEKTPETVLAKAKVLSRQGDFQTASKIATEIAATDKGDRFLNTKATKYATLAGNLDEANSLAADFPTRSGDNKDGLKYMVDLEAVNFLSRLALAYSLQNDHMMALKRAENTVGVFTQYNQDQYDFHYYGPRRGTLRAYLQLLDWEDALYTHPVYKKAAEVAIHEYVAYATKAPDGVDPKELNALVEQRMDMPLVEGADADPDPWGLEYREIHDPLARALDIWRPLSEAKPTDPATWQLVYDVYLAQKKYVFALQALKKAKEFGASDSWVASAGVLARNTLEKDEAASAALRSLQLKMLPTVCTQGNIAEQSLRDYTDSYVSNDFEWAKTRLAIGEHDGIEERLSKSIGEPEQTRKTLVELKRWGLGQEYAKEVKKKWPRASFV